MIAGEVVREIGATLWPAAAEVAEAQLPAAQLGPELREQLAGRRAAAGTWARPWCRASGSCRRDPWARWRVRPSTGCCRPCARRPAGREAVQSVLELLLVRSASPLVVLEPLRGADIGIAPRARDAMLAQLVRRRIGDMRETAARLAATGAAAARPSAAALLRLVADLDALEGKWPVSPEDRAALAEIRGSASAFVGAGIENAVRQEILAQLGSAGQSGRAERRRRGAAGGDGPPHAAPRHRRRQARARRQRRRPARALPADVPAKRSGARRARRQRAGRAARPGAHRRDPVRPRCGDRSSTTSSAAAAPQPRRALTRLSRPAGPTARRRHRRRPGPRPSARPRASPRASRTAPWS